MEGKINISKELIQIGILTPVIKKFIKFLVTFDVYDDFLKMVTILREKGYRKSPKYHMDPSEILMFYLGSRLNPYYFFYEGYFEIDVRFYKLPDQKFWRIVNEMWREYLNTY